MGGAAGRARNPAIHQARRRRCFGTTADALHAAGIVLRFALVRVWADQVYCSAWRLPFRIDYEIDSSLFLLNFKAGTSSLSLAGLY